MEFTHPVALLSVHVDTKFVTLSAYSDDGDWSVTVSNVLVAIIFN